MLQGTYLLYLIEKLYNCFSEISHERESLPETEVCLTATQDRIIKVRNYEKYINKKGMVDMQYIPRYMIISR